MAQEPATDLERRLAEGQRELSEALERQAATDEVLRVIASSPGELEPIFETILSKATQICEAQFGYMFRYRDGALHPAAVLRVPQALAEYVLQRGAFQPHIGSALDRLVRAKTTVHICDVAVEEVSNPAARLAGARSYLAVPMLKDTALIGTIVIYRTEVRPFHRKADRAGPEFCTTGRHCHREYAPTQRAERVASAADRNCRCAQGHQPLHIRSSDRAQYAGRIGRAAMRRGHGEHLATRGHELPSCSELRGRKQIQRVD